MGNSFTKESPFSLADGRQSGVTAAAKGSRCSPCSGSPARLGQTIGPTSAVPSGPKARPNRPAQRSNPNVRTTRKERRRRGKNSYNRCIFHIFHIFRISFFFFRYYCLSLLPQKGVYQPLSLGAAAGGPDRRAADGLIPNAGWLESDLRSGGGREAKAKGIGLGIDRGQMPRHGSRRYSGNVECETQKKQLQL